MTTMREMLEAGVHFGHQTRFWNPKMTQYIYGFRNKVHIINLEQTVICYQEALKFIRNLAAKRGTLLFVGTKRQARGIIIEEATRCNSPYIAERWLGGTLTNFKTIRRSVKHLQELEQKLQGGALEKLGKKEGLIFQRQLAKLSKSLGGIKNMPTLPDALFVIDVGYHHIAVTEANMLGIPVIGVVDTNHSPDGITYMIPGNDDSSRAIRLYARDVADIVLEGRKQATQDVKEMLSDEYVELDPADAAHEQEVQ